MVGRIQNQDPVGSQRAALADLLSRLPGVAVVNVEVGSARVELDESRTSEQEVRDAVARAGFTPRGVTPS